MNRSKRKAPRESVIDRLGGKANVIAMIVFFIIAVGGGIAWMEIEAREAERAQYIDSWPITMNQNIEWTWAGKENTK